MPEKKTNKKKYTATVKVMGKKFSGTGDSILEALGGITTGGIGGTIILTVKGKNGEKDRVLPLPMARRLFNTSGLTREVALKNVSLMFDGV